MSLGAPGERDGGKWRIVATRGLMRGRTLAAQTLTPEVETWLGADEVGAGCRRANMQEAAPRWRRVRLLPPIVVAASVLLWAAPALAAPEAGAGAVDWTSAVACDGSRPRDLDAPDPAVPGLRVRVESFCAGDAPLAEPTGADALASDCTRPTHGLLGWRWVVPYSARVDPANPSGLPPAGVLSAFQASLDAWDAATGAEIAGAVALGGAGAAAGALDGANQFGWKPLSSGTIAVTITWYAPTIARPALESDAAYNANYAWRLDGSAGGYDLQHIATHEVGHTFGLADLYDSADSCLTMYGYGSTGQTHARTLGEGDVVGLRKLYGA